MHRDVKPENILLDEDGQALVADFGIALAVEQAGGARLTQTGLSLGTPAYMSPEQVMAERRITPRADVYALGAVLYELLAGEPPFTGPSAQAVVARVLTEAPRSLTGQRPSVPPHVAAAVQTALEKLPADRFASAAAFARALDGPAPASDAPAPAASRHGRPRASRRAVRWLAALAAGAGLVAAGAVAGRRWPGRAAAPASGIRSTLLPPAGEQFAGGDGLALSADGTQLAFTVLRAAPRPRLFVRTLASGAVRELPGTAGASFPFWSPDGRWVAFFAEGELRTVAADGGPVTTVAAALVPRGGAWAPDGTILFAADPGVLYRVAPGGGPPAAVTKRGAEGLHERPIFLPDGHRFLFSGVDRRGTVFLGDLRTGAVRRVRRDARCVAYAPPGYLLFEAPGPPDHSRLMVQPFDPERGVVDGGATLVSDSVHNPLGWPGYTISATGVLIYQPSPVHAPRVWLDRRGAALDSVPPDSAWTYRLSHDGARVAQGGFGLWVRDLRRGVTIKLPTPESDIQMEPVWSPDDARIAYQAYAFDGRAGGIHIARVDGSGEATSLPAPPGGALARPLDWSPDGRALLVGSEAAAGAPQASLWLADVQTRAVTHLVTALGGPPYARFSPDGRWVAYQSAETGAPEVYLRPYPGPGAPVRVSPAGGGRPAWRADGRELFYLTPRGDLMAAAVSPGPRPDVGPPRRLLPAVTYEPYSDVTPYDVAPDGQRFLLGAELRIPTSPLTLLAPWRLTLPAAPP